MIGCFGGQGPDAGEQILHGRVIFDAQRLFQVPNGFFVVPVLEFDFGQLETGAVSALGGLGSLLINQGGMGQIILSGIGPREAEESLAIERSQSQQVLQRLTRGGPLVSGHLQGRIWRASN